MGVEASGVRQRFLTCVTTATPLLRIPAPPNRGTPPCVVSAEQGWRRTHVVATGAEGEKNSSWAASATKLVRDEDIVGQFFVGLTPSPPARCRFARPPPPSFSPSFTRCLLIAVRYLVCRRTEARLLNKAAAVTTHATNAMSVSSGAAKLQTPPQQRQVHYISDNVYSLGTLSCAVCGQTFPIHTNACQRSTCGWCGTLHEPGTHSALQQHHRAMRRTGNSVKMSSKVCSLDTSAALFFTEKEVTAAVEYIRQTLGDTSPFGTAPGAVGGAKRAGITEVDNRIIEEAFCETCGVHRPCKTFARQTRSADEGQTIFFQCTKCSSEWQQNS